MTEKLRRALRIARFEGRYAVRFVPLIGFPFPGSISWRKVLRTR